MKVMESQRKEAGKMQSKETKSLTTLHIKMYFKIKIFYTNQTKVLSEVLNHSLRWLTTGRTVLETENMMAIKAQLVMKTS